MPKSPTPQQENPRQGAGFSLPSCLLHPWAPASAAGRRPGDSIPLATHGTTGDTSRNTLNLETKEASNLSLKQLHWQ